MALNVLVVDDSSTMRAMIIKTLRLSNLPLASVHQAPLAAARIRLDTGWAEVSLYTNEAFAIKECTA